jgi:hypothetical protein
MFGNIAGKYRGAAIMRRNHFPLLAVVLLSCLTIVACAAGVESTRVDLLRYTPSFGADLTAYRGLRVYLPDVDNQAADTTIWYYYSPDQLFTYGSNSSLRNYFWYSFEKALVSVGMVVSNTRKSSPRAPVMWVVLKSITDEKYEVDVKLQESDWVFFLKTYGIAGDPVDPAHRTPDNLEKRAYRMTNRLVETILTDPEFKRSFLKATAEAAKSRDR